MGGDGGWARVGCGFLSPSPPLPETGGSAPGPLGGWDRTVVGCRPVGGCAHPSRPRNDCPPPRWEGGRAPEHAVRAPVGLLLRYPRRVERRHLVHRPRRALDQREGEKGARALA